MTMSEPVLVRDVMLPGPEPIPIHTSLSAAEQQVLATDAEWVPVEDGGTLVSVLAAADLESVRRRGLDCHGSAQVSDLALPPALLCPPGLPLDLAILDMAERRCGCAVVVEGSRVVGLLPWHVAVLAHTGSGRASALKQLVTEGGPSQVRSVVLTEHMTIRLLIAHLERATNQMLRSSVRSAASFSEVNRLAHDLVGVMQRHFELENTVLAPILRGLDAWGDVRADRMLSEHASQCAMLGSFKQELKHAAGTAEHDRLAGLVSALSEAIQQDMRIEEQGLLRPDLLRDDPLPASVELG
jgi:hemerythrin-like domain-containing protein